MTYAVQADLVAEFGDSELAQLTDRVNGTVTDATVLGSALTRADDEINSYVAQVYTLPFATVPTRLKAIAMDISRYYLFDARPPQAVKDRYDRSYNSDQGGRTIGGVIADNDHRARFLNLRSASRV